MKKLTCHDVIGPNLGGILSPAFQKIEILFNIEKGVGPNVLLTRGVGRGSWIVFNRFILIISADTSR